METRNRGRLPASGRLREHCDPSSPRFLSQRRTAGHDEVYNQPPRGTEQVIRRHRDRVIVRFQVRLVRNTCCTIACRDESRLDESRTVLFPQLRS
jgi:hypothetical protein